MNEPHSEETIVVEALRLPPAERSAYLDQATGGNMALRQRVESLLTSYQAGDFLEQAAAPVVRQTIVLSTPLTERAGDKIGRYKLLQQIGEGGCGVVYMAEQEEPVRRRVALKIIKAGMDTKSVIARFEAERQALALMDHPNIAKVLDAGATEAGRPYFVMELVRGMKITDYCDEAKLPFRARLDLFMQVCHAIQHAHQKGIIHRDIKPSNILVTINDGVPVPKVIDFGIAKATGGQQLTDKTIFTAFEQFIGTPAYMSPEQAMLTSLDIDSRSDIYSLGVLLYELLTGKTPFDAHELLAIGLDEMRRTIREKEPERPSTRLSTLPDKELTTTAQSRGLNAPKLVSELRGDLDWIVMKALEKDRARRYETANGLAADIQRHLLNEPVVACPPSTIYRFQKLVRRNKLAFAATATVFVSLTLGLTVSAILFFKERAARRHADEQAAIAQAISDFLQNDLLGQAKTSEQAQEGIPVDPNLTVRQAVDRAGARLDGRFTNQPLVEASIRSTLADVYDELNEMEASRSHAQRAFDLRRRILGPQDPLTIQVMMLLRDPDPAKQVALKERALELAKHVFGSNDTLSLRCMNDLGKAYRSMGRFDKALPLLEQSVKLHKAKFGPQSGETLWTLHYLGVAYVAAGRKDLAAPLLEENFRLLKNMFGPDHPLTLADMGELACAYEGVDRMDDALRLMEECVQLYKTKLGPENPATLSSMNFLGMLYAEAGRRSDALPLLEVLKVWQAKLSPDNPERPQTMFNLAVAYENTGQTDKALPLLEEALKIRKLKFGSDNPVTLQTMNELGVAYDNARR